MLSTAKSLAGTIKSTDFKFPIAQARSLYVTQTAIVILIALGIQMAQLRKTVCSIYRYPLTEINTKVSQTLLYVDYKEFHVSWKKFEHQ